MVSFTLDAVKFLLIYRYLQNIYRFKRETVVTRPTLRGSGMPTVAERATSRAHADMDITSPFATQYTRIEKGCAYIHIPRTSTVASSLTTIEIYQIP